MMNDVSFVIFLVVLGLGVLRYFLYRCPHKYSIVASIEGDDVLRCRKCRKTSIAKRSKYRKPKSGQTGLNRVKK